MPRASATHRGKLMIIDDGREIKCNHPSLFGGTCGRLLVKHGCIKCSRCKTEFNLLDLIQASVGGRRKTLESVVHDIQWRCWWSIAKRGVHERWVEEGKFLQPSLPARFADQLHHCWLHGMTPICLTRTEEWALVATTRRSEFRLHLGLIEPNSEFVRFSDLATMLKRAQSLLKSNMEVRMPRDRYEWADAQTAVKYILGLEEWRQSRDDFSYWVGTPERPEIVGPCVRDGFTAGSGNVAIMMILAMSK